MALKQSTSPETTQPQANTPNTQQQAMHLFDILPQLHELLSRIDHSQTLPILTPELETTEDADLGARYPIEQPLEPKDLPTAILALKAQMRRGLRELEMLPDMERSVRQQEEEIMELEEKCRAQAEVLRGLGVSGREVMGRLET